MANLNENQRTSLHGTTKNERRTVKVERVLTRRSDGHRRQLWQVFKRELSAKIGETELIDRQGFQTIAIRDAERGLGIVSITIIFESKRFFPDLYGCEFVKSIDTKFFDIDKRRVSNGDCFKKREVTKFELRNVFVISSPVWKHDFSK